MSLEFDIVQKYLGVHYRHHGRDMDGLDCWGLIKAVYKDLGHDLLDIEDYDREWSSKGANYFVENYHKQWEKVEIPQMFDVVMFKNKAGVSCHAGIVLREGSMFHCVEKYGVVVAKVSERNADRLIDGFYRFKGAK
jgi:cell wall-associated NlpC family hydrolase